MKTIAIAVSMFVPCAAHAAAPSAMAALSGATGQAAAVVPAALPVPALPAGLDRALASDVLDLNVQNADFLASYAQASGYAVFRLDGARMTGKAALLSYVSYALRLPGPAENWDALIDYMGDLPTIHRNNRILVVVKNSSRIRLADDKLYSDFREVAEFTCKNAREWSRGGVTLKFAFVN